jgi:hypothetical protein
MQNRQMAKWENLAFAEADWLAPYDYYGTTPGENVVFWNGDDAISLQKKQTDTIWIDIDIFGEIGIRPLNSQGGRGIEVPCDV